MTDDQRFRLDQKLRQQHEQAKADLSRARQQADDHGEYLQGLGATLRGRPENVNLWKTEADRWRSAFSSDGARLSERELPEWQGIQEITNEIRRLTDDVQRLERELRNRGLV